MPKPKIAWRFQAAAPSSGAAAVCEDGSVYLSTVEGYVHALAPDGTYRWSYGLSGIPIGAPAVDRARQVYVATSAQRLYAVRPDGRLAWVHRSPVRIKSDVIWSAPGALFFAGSDLRLYSLAAWGSQLWSRHMLAPVAAAPSSLGGSWVGVGTAADDLWLFRNSALVARVALPAALRQPLLSGTDQWFALAGDELLALSPDREARIAWRTNARYAALSSDSEWLVVETGQEARWLDPRTGDTRHRASLPDAPSAAPAVTNGGIVLMPMASGELLAIEPGSGSTSSVKVGSAPLRAPVWHERLQRVVAVAGNGVVASIELQGWARPPAGGVQTWDPAADEANAVFTSPESPAPSRSGSDQPGGGA